MARRDLLEGVRLSSYWLDDAERPPPRPPLSADVGTDLLIVGGGFTGLWTAVLAKEADPERDVTLVEAERIGWAASGRNGGFCAASLTHGAVNGRDRFPDEADLLRRLGVDNLRGLVDSVERHRVDCHLERSGELMVATQPYQVAGLQEEADHGGGTFLDRDAVRGEVDSPTYQAGLWDREGAVMVHPARLAWGLARAAEELGVVICEGSRATGIETAGADHGGAASRLLVGVDRRDDGGGSVTVTARQVVLGTNAFPSLLRRVRPYIMPVYDYAVVTEPLTSEQLAEIGWRHRQGIGDCGNQFHYYRLTADDRILFGGYDAVYYFGKRVKASYDVRRATFELLTRHLEQTFPSLAPVRLSHAWGGAIDLCGRFFAFFDTAYGGQVASAAGFTGLGVGATRFAGQVMLDLLSGVETERTATAMVRSKPLPFPPEPLAWLGVHATRASIRAADRNEGRRNLWLRTLDRIGLGFDS